MLRWTYNNNVNKFIVYRSRGDEPVSMYGAVQGNLKEFVDRKLEFNTTYRYRVKAVFADGSESMYSDEVVVNY